LKNVLARGIPEYCKWHNIEKRISSFEKRISTILKNVLARGIPEHCEI